MSRKSVSNALKKNSAVSIAAKKIHKYKKRGKELVIIIKERATLEQVEQMLQTLRIYIKVTVDIERGILAGGGEKHALCEAALLEDGSKQRDIWGADWTPFDQSIACQ